MSDMAIYNDYEHDYNIGSVTGLVSALALTIALPFFAAFGIPFSWENAMPERPGEIGGLEYKTSATIMNTTPVDANLGYAFFDANADNIPDGEVEHDLFMYNPGDRIEFYHSRPEAPGSYGRVGAYQVSKINGKNTPALEYGLAQQKFHDRLVSELKGGTLVQLIESRAKYNDSMAAFHRRWHGR
jgi:hypothetical protein